MYSNLLHSYIPLLTDLFPTTVWIWRFDGISVPPCSVKSARITSSRLLQYISTQVTSAIKMLELSQQTKDLKFSKIQLSATLTLHVVNRIFDILQNHEQVEEPLSVVFIYQTFCLQNVYISYKLLLCYTKTAKTIQFTETLLWAINFSTFIRCKNGGHELFHKFYRPTMGWIYLSTACEEHQHQNVCGSVTWKFFL